MKNIHTFEQYKYLSLNEGEKSDKKYSNVIFSEDFYKKDENMIKYLEKDYLKKNQGN